MLRSAWLAVVLTLISGCASAPPAAPIARPFEEVRRISLVGSGDSAFAIIENRSEPGRTIDEVLAWHPYGGLLRPLAKLVHRGIGSVLKADPEEAVGRSVEDVAPRARVLAAMARRLEASGAFAGVRPFVEEPTAADRQQTDAL